MSESLLPPNSGTASLQSIVRISLDNQLKDLTGRVADLNQELFRYLQCDDADRLESCMSSLIADLINCRRTLRALESLQRGGE